jgi:hypothetical protein
MYLNLRDLPTIMSLWDKILLEKGRIQPNLHLLNTVLEASMRLNESDRIV